MTAYQPGQWPDLFVAMAGTVAALAALTFVAVSINLTWPRSIADGRRVCPSAGRPVNPVGRLSRGVEGPCHKASDGRGLSDQ